MILSNSLSNIFWTLLKLFLSVISSKDIVIYVPLFLTWLSSFTFVVNFKANLDEDTTRYLEDDFFLNYDDTRLIVRTSESLDITDEMLQKAMVENVISIEKYDAITDMNYYRINRDYKYFLGGGWDDSGNNFIDSSSIQILNSDHFMRSGSSLNDNDIKEGRLPTGKYEMVVFSNDSSILGTTELVLFKNSRKWGLDAYYKYNITIVGLLKEPTHQAYFSNDICDIMELNSYNLNLKYSYKYSGSLSKNLNYSNHFLPFEVFYLIHLCQK